MIVAHDPIREQLTPDPDGLITDFYTTRDYEPQSVSVWIYGLRLRADWDDGYTLPGGKVVRFKIAPLPESTLEAQYEPR